MKIKKEPDALAGARGAITTENKSRLGNSEQTVKPFTATLFSILPGTFAELERRFKR
jgi:hypothetical protein